MANPSKDPLTRERILRAALDLADSKGVETLSMRKLGELLHVEAMSLYRHVPNKDAILDGIVDIVAGEIELPSGKDWKTAMRRRCRSAHEVLMKHPWATLLIVSRANVGPNMLRYVDATIGCFRTAGFSFPMADHAWNALDSFVYGFTLAKLNFPFEPSEYAEAARQFLPLLPPGKYPHLVGLSLEIIEGRHDGLHDLNFGLNVLLNGIDRLRRESQ